MGNGRRNLVSTPRGSDSSGTRASESDRESHRESISGLRSNTLIVANRFALIASGHSVYPLIATPVPPARLNSSATELILPSTVLVLPVQDYFFLHFITIRLRFRISARELEPGSNRATVLSTFCSLLSTVYCLLSTVYWSLHITRFEDTIVWDADESFSGRAVCNISSSNSAVTSRLVRSVSISACVDCFRA